MHTSITYRVLFPGIVPFFEECEAARWGNFNLREWGELDVDVKALVVAQQRVSRWVALHAEDAVATAAEKKAERR